MKKNKKYWKQQAKSWREIAEMETESANEWAGEAMILGEQLEDLNAELYSAKTELSVLRQYNIGKKPFTTGSGMNVDWKIHYKNQKLNQAKEDLANWSKYKERDPDWNNNPESESAGCNCKNCNCNN